MSDNQEGHRAGSGERESTGEDGSQPRDPDTGEFLPSGTPSTTDRDRDDERRHDAGDEREDAGDERDRGSEHGDDADDRSGAPRRSGRRGSSTRVESGGTTRRRGGTHETNARGDRRGSRGAVTFGQPPIGSPTSVTPGPAVQPITTYLRRPGPSAAAGEDREAVVPQEVLQTSVEREYPPWIAKPSRERDEPARGDDERESWEAPVVHPRSDATDAGRREEGGRRPGPERLATRRSPDRPRDPPRPHDGQPRERPRGGQYSHTAERDDPSPDQAGVFRPVTPALENRHLIGTWVQSGPGDLPPHLRPSPTVGGSTGPREGVRRYTEPQEVTVGRESRDLEGWEYTESGPDVASERWETGWDGEPPERDERTRRGHGHSAGSRHDRRGRRQGLTSQRERDDDRSSRPDLLDPV